MLHRDIREAIYYLRNPVDTSQRRLGPSEILERIKARFPHDEVSIRSVYRWMDCKPEPPPESSPRVTYQQPQTFRAPEPDHHWDYPVIDVTPGRSNLRQELQPQRPIYKHPETGLFISKKEFEEITSRSNSHALTGRESEQDVTPPVEFDMFSELSEWIGRKLIGEVPQDEGARATDLNETCSFHLMPMMDCQYAHVSQLQTTAQAQAQEKEEKLKQHKQRARQIGSFVVVGLVALSCISIYSINRK